MISEKRRRLILLAGASAMWPLPMFADDTDAGDNKRHTLHLGVVSERAKQPDYVLEQYAPFLDCLRRQLLPKGIVLGELRVARDLAELAGFIRSGTVDIILESMMSIFRINADGVPVEPALAAWRKGRRETSTVFFVRQNSQIKHLRDLAGKSLALESPRSTTAYTLPKIVLRQNGLLVEQLGTRHERTNSVRYVLAESETNQAYWVDRGRADAGAFNTEDWEGLPKTLRQELRIIHATDPILRWMLSARTGLPSKVLAAVETALLGMHESVEGASALQQAGRIRRFDRLSREDLASIDSWRLVATRWKFGE